MKNIILILAAFTLGIGVANAQTKTVRLTSPTGVNFTLMGDPGASGGPYTLMLPGSGGTLLLNGATSFTAGDLSNAGSLVISDGNGEVGSLEVTDLSNDRTYTFPDASGTVALTSDLDNYWQVGGNNLGGGNTIVFGNVNNDDLSIITNNDEAIGIDGTTQNVTINTDLSVTNSFSTGGTLNADAAATLNSTLDVTGATTLNNTLSVTGTSSFGDVQVTGNTTLGDVSGDEVTITAATVNANNLPAGSSNTFVISNAGALQTRSITDMVTGSGTAGRLTRWTGTGTTVSNGSLDDDANGVLSRAGSIELNPGTGNSLTTDGSFIAAEGLTVSAGGASIGGNSTVTGTLGVTGNTTLTGDLNITGSTTIGSDASDVLYVYGSIAGEDALVFEGMSPDGTTTTFIIDDPTTNRDIRFPDASGTVVLSPVLMGYWPITPLSKTGTADDLILGPDNQDPGFEDQLVLVTDGTPRITLGGIGGVLVQTGFTTQENTNLGNDDADVTVITGAVSAGAGTDRFAGRVEITGDGVTNNFVINNTQVTAGSVIVVTVESGTDPNVYAAMVGARNAGVSFTVTFTAAITNGDTVYLNYIIIQ